MTVWSETEDRPRHRVWRPAQRIERRRKNQPSLLAEPMRIQLGKPEPPPNRTFRNTIFGLQELSPPPADAMREPFWLPIFIVLVIGILIGAAGYAALHGFRP